MAEAAPTVVVAAACTAAATLCACTAASSLGLSSGASGSGSLYGKAQRSGEPPEEEYGDEEIVSLEAVWGKGFLSPGGPAEVGALLAGPPPDQHDDGDGSAAVISLRGKHVLDIGAGSGGIDLLLVQQYGAAAVHAVDCEQGVLDRAAALWREADIPAGVISTQRVSREWYLSDEIEASPPFDVVFSKDSIVHVENKAAVMKALFRVLKPGGVLCISDWMCSEGVEAGAAAAITHHS
jgi:2-polyprenyl-3-methyl-5-hydroxy-6-metoxy-1,4-benzoquinol methylase